MTSGPAVTTRGGLPAQGEYRWVYLWDAPLRAMHWLAAITLTMAAVLAALVGPGILIVTTIRQFARAAPGYERGLAQATEVKNIW